MTKGEERERVQVGGMEGGSGGRRKEREEGGDV